MTTIWVIDDDASSRELLARVLGERGWNVEQLTDGCEALDRLAAGTVPDLVISDIRMAEVDGLAVTEAFHRDAPATPVILVTAFGNVDGAVEAIRRGAFDYVSKPYDVDAVQHTAARALEQRRLAEENRALRRQLRDKYRLENAVGRSEAMLQVFKTAARAAGQFVPVDCGAIAEGVLESELFGHVRGAFTGAQAARRGLFEEAGGGTIFLDEIGDVGPGLQARLLRALQEGTIRRVGATEAIPVDARVVAATNRDLEGAVKSGKFREDLYYRLNVVTIRIPPLRERREEVPLLAEHFAAKHGRGEGATVSAEARELLQAYHWPGNVRELENVIARALALNPSGVVVPADLPDRLRDGPAAEPARGLLLPPGFRPTLDDLGRRYAALVLSECQGNKTRAAELLGIDRKTLYRILGEGE